MTRALINRRPHVTATTFAALLAITAVWPARLDAALRMSAAAQDSAFGVSSPAYIAIRWLWFLAITGVVGAVAFNSLVLRRSVELPGESRHEAAATAARVGLACAAFALAAAGLRLVAQSVALLGALGLDSLVIVTGTAWGTAWLVHAVAAVLAVIGFALAVRSSPVGWWVAACAAIGLATSPALGGHSAAAPFQPWPVIADAAHVIGAGAWIGGLLVMLAAGLPAVLRSPSGRTRHVASLVSAFSPLALASAATIVASGTFAAWLHIGSLTALVQSTYGRVLGLKLIGFLAVAGLGARNFLKLKPRLNSGAAVDSLSRSAAAEVALGAILLLVTAVLVATPPARDATAMVGLRAEVHEKIPDSRPTP